MKNQLITIVIAVVFLAAIFGNEVLQVLGR
jgi:hypothetical protein